MSRINAKQRFEFEAILLDADSSETQYRQIEMQIRSAITSGMLIVGAKVPSSRKLAQIIGVSRNTVPAAYEQLISEGYLETSRGSGTRVSTLPPDVYCGIHGRFARRVLHDGSCHYHIGISARIAISHTGTAGAE